MFLLDTDVFSATRRPGRAPTVAAWVAAQGPQDLYLSVLTVGEVEGGIHRQDSINPGFAADLRRWIAFALPPYGDRILPFGTEEARIWGRLSAEIGHASPDLMIAATALARGLTVATGNVADFTPTGVRVVNPFEP